jgi:DNA-binding transcriptional MerR regulator
MKEYDTSDVANIVGIAKPTVNKYTRALEKAGYQITRNHKGNRIYTENDIRIIEKVKDQSNDTKMPVEQIANILVSQQKGNTDSTIQSISDITTLKENEVKTGDSLHINDEQYHTLLDEIDSLKQLIINQQKYIDEKLEQRDRRLLESIREMQEVKQLQLEIAATQEEEEKKKGFFARLLGK